MRTRDGVEQYRAEPYVVAADVYAHPMHLGRGGWTWYTGSAGWMYQAAIEGLLGLRRNGDTLIVAPSIPAMWPEFSIRWKVGTTTYHITVANPEHRCRGVRSAELDGVSADPAAIPVLNDGQTHQLNIVLGSAAPRAVASPIGATIGSAR
jgi:cyclic beta-1,2-glucan synthetase